MKIAGLAHASVSHGGDLVTILQLVTGNFLTPGLRPVPSALVSVLNSRAQSLRVAFTIPLSVSHPEAKGQAGARGHWCQRTLGPGTGEAEDTFKSQTKLLERMSESVPTCASEPAAQG